MSEEVNKEVLTKLCEALRSGEYVQGRGSLASVVGGQVRYCCLGVLCAVQGLVPRFKGTESNAFSPGMAIPPDGYYAGIPMPGLWDLYHLNDLYMWNFNKIADYIEETYLT